jgi:bifunctional DNA-binding transcriptional regulator/antitoxin component of YhaV-PrlF toxin-antitoxin module
MKTVSIIRDRGQLTIPDSIRSIVNWMTPMSAVSISVVKPDEIIIRPHNSFIDSSKIWEQIKNSRLIKGKGGISTLEFLQQDRQSH